MMNLEKTKGIRATVVLTRKKMLIKDAEITYVFHAGSSVFLLEGLIVIQVTINVVTGYSTPSGGQLSPATSPRHTSLSFTVLPYEAECSGLHMFDSVCCCLQ